VAFLFPLSDVREAKGYISEFQLTASKYFELYISLVTFTELQHILKMPQDLTH
jgi:hypothetical protein